MVDAHQNLNGSHDLTTPFSGMIVSPPTMKIWKVIQNIKNGVV